MVVYEVYRKKKADSINVNIPYQFPVADFSVPHHALQFDQSKRVRVISFYRPPLQDTQKLLFAGELEFSTHLEPTDKLTINTKTVDRGNPRVRYAFA